MPTLPHPAVSGSPRSKPPLGPRKQQPIGSSSPQLPLNAAPLGIAGSRSMQRIPSASGPGARPPAAAAMPQHQHQPLQLGQALSIRPAAATPTGGPDYQVLADAAATLATAARSLATSPTRRDKTLSKVSGGRGHVGGGPGTRLMALLGLRGALGLCAEPSKRALAGCKVGACLSRVATQCV